MWTEVKKGILRQGTPSTKDKKQASTRELDFSKFKTLMLQKHHQGDKRKTHNMEKIFEIPINKKGLISRIFKF